MRNFNLILLSIILLSICNVTGQTLERILQDKDYLAVLNSLAESENPFEKLDNASIDQIKTITKITYEAYECCPDKVNKYVALKNEEWNSMVRLDKSKISIPRVGSIQGKIWELIEQKISKKTYELLRISFLIKATIVSKDTSLYIDNSTKFRYSKVNVKVEVEDIIKGKHKFKVGEKFEFYYLLNWEKPKSEFVIGKTYLLPLEPRAEDNINYSNIALITYIDCPDVVFEIKSNSLIDKENYFGYGSEVPWEVFKSKFNETVKLIKEEK
ncbi:MAG: hypothetical protein B6D44_05865 [Ignavibacteriales bacterium UTCHB2]|jgi:hypothetical protein|nr:MAG: hypothetical protein BWY38_00446 [Ignavibacteria bacterium ADurb.Bin266]OQY73914.1 MAG: hypothetical protein B6D44_05865 [Ignavibacteriales bacterium UTCHB2]HQI39907.1 hypothetical protein [Ignavibacteriaceae bacterium]